MSLKGQYVKDRDGVIGMIESEEVDDEGLVMVYYGTQDRNEVRWPRYLSSLDRIEPPANARVDGELPPAELAEVRSNDDI